MHKLDRVAKEMDNSHISHQTGAGLFTLSFQMTELIK